MSRLSAGIESNKAELGLGVPGDGEMKGERKREVSEVWEKDT